MQMEKLVTLFLEEFRRCKLRENETAIVLTGGRSSPAYAQAALQAISKLGAQGFQMHIPSAARRDQAMEEGTYVGKTALTGQRLALSTLKDADFVVDLLQLLHSPEQVEILQAGTRMLLIAEPPEVLASRPPTELLRTQVEAACDALQQARTLRITSAAGTDIEMAVGQYPVISQYGYTDTPGRWDHWPSAFLYTWPNEGSTNGRVVLDTGDFVWPLNRYLTSPVALTVRNGYITAIEGEDDAQVLREQMAAFNDPEAYAIAHIGWGLDERADWEALKTHPTSVGTDPRSYVGNVQFSTGPNTEVGGERHTLGHFDMPMLRCTLALDGVDILREGKVVGPRADMG